MYARLSPAWEHRGYAVRRKELLAGLAGRVVEVGAGNGLNFRHYPLEVTAVLAIEPEPYLRSCAKVKARRAPIPVEVVAGTLSASPRKVRHSTRASCPWFSARCPTRVLRSPSCTASSGPGASCASSSTSERTRRRCGESSG